MRDRACGDVLPSNKETLCNSTRKARSEEHQFDAIKDAGKWAYAEVDAKVGLMEKLNPLNWGSNKIGMSMGSVFVPHLGAFGG